MKRLMPYFFIGPALLALVALVVYPLLYGVYISFFKTNLANKWDFVGLKNYISVFSDGVFVKQLGVTLKFTAIVVLAHFIIGIFLAMLLNQSRPGITFFRTILVLPWLMPEVVIALIFKWIMNPLYGLLNYGMQLLGLSEGGVSWLGDTKYAFISVVLVCIWKGYPLVMVNALAALQSVSTDIYEAAKVDGANNIQTFFRIILPSIKPVLATTLILDTVWWFKHYTIVYLMTKGGPGSDTSIVSIEIYKQAFDYFNFGKAASMSVVVFFVCLIISKLYRRFLDNED
ncbi:sugar ABC transporter permease [Enterocloster sp. 210928-DFI.2.20]|jgi:multiple sugar transport system permease protein|uniref:carbohydrate ABC transporter permease n=1 Tax=Enterocloster TaxID=2719313 RepID=UPI001D077707|nr:MULTISPECIES: sugar ABC transporter permease [Enterocloster]MCB7095166.1 sugar ABC transporter permease [Enterocloster sp. 210928-DFI.2.20]MCB7354425.1 sugar ABC transporter permease [Enterocloster bolteae]